MKKTAHQLVLEPLDSTTWRLCDRSVSRHDADTVLACVERVAPDAFEVTWVFGGLSTQRLSSLDAVLMAGVARLHGASDSAMRIER